MTESSMDETTYCSVHPDRETGLRCNRCGRYMCPQCAVSTSVGYRCKECVRQVEDKFFSGTNTDYLVTVALTAGATAALVIGGDAIGLIHIFIASVFIGVIYGGALDQALRWVLKKRRARYTGIIAGAGVIIGAAAGALITGALASIGIWIVAGVAASIVYGRFR